MASRDNAGAGAVSGSVKEALGIYSGSTNGKGDRHGKVRDVLCCAVLTVWMCDV